MLTLEFVKAVSSYGQHSFARVAMEQSTVGQKPNDECYSVDGANEWRCSEPKSMEGRGTKDTTNRLIHGSQGKVRKDIKGPEPVQ